MKATSALLLELGQAQGDHQRVEVGVLAAAAVVEIDERLERLFRAVVHIRGAPGRVAHRGRLEGPHVARVFRHGIAALVGVLGVRGRHAEVVETTVAEIGAPVAGGAVSLAVEDLEPLLFQGGQGPMVAARRSGRNANRS